MSPAAFFGKPRDSPWCRAQRKGGRPREGELLRIASPAFAKAPAGSFLFNSKRKLAERMRF